MAETITSKTPPKKTKKVGRPSKFDTINKEQLKTLVLKGFTDDEVSKFFGIDDSTLHRWKLSNAMFCESLKDWKRQADEEIERSLYESAKGYKTSYQKNMVVSDGKDSGSHIETVTEEIAFAPNPTSIIFWLKNRQPKQWRDKQDVEFSGSVSWEGLMNDIAGAKEKSIRELQGITNN